MPSRVTTRPCTCVLVIFFAGDKLLSSLAALNSKHLLPPAGAEGREPGVAGLGCSGSRSLFRSHGLQASCHSRTIRRAAPPRLLAGVVSRWPWATCFSSSPLCRFRSCRVAGGFPQSGASKGKGEAMVRATVCLYFCLLLFLLVVLLRPGKRICHTGYTCTVGVARRLCLSQCPGDRAPWTVTVPHASRTAGPGEGKRVESHAGLLEILLLFSTI